MPTRSFNHDGKDITHFDYRGLSSENDMLDMLDEMKDTLEKAENKLLVLSDFRDTTVSSSFVSRAKKYGKEVFKVKSAKHAIIGITGVKKVLLKAYKTFSGDHIIAFDSEEEALAYLSG